MSFTTKHKNTTKLNIHYQLLHLNSVFDLPWLIVGDLNELESSNEKRGGRPVSLRRLSRLPHFLQTSHCKSVMAQGCPFTWKKRIHGSWIYERLDRGLARRDFCNLYPNLGAIHSAFTFSDHCPIVFNTDPKDHYPRACPFHF